MQLLGLHPSNKLFLNAESLLFELFLVPLDGEQQEHQPLTKQEVDELIQQGLLQQKWPGTASENVFNLRSQQ